MVALAFDPTETLVHCGSSTVEAAILCDRQYSQIITADWFTPSFWGDSATTIRSSGRGGAWFISTELGDVVLRHYLRGGFIANFSHNKYVWRGANKSRSFMEYRLMRHLYAQGLSLPKVLGAYYLRDPMGFSYKTALVMERIPNVKSLAELIHLDIQNTPWKDTGILIAQFHRAGLNHIDLNANNILFDDNKKGWLIDFDRCHLRILATPWRKANLARLERSLIKITQPHQLADIRNGVKILREAYDTTWKQGI